MNRVVARYQDGRSAKGMTSDFFPNKDRFHLLPTDAPPGTKPVEILISDLKAVFFVKEFAGNPQHKKANQGLRDEENPSMVGVPPIGTLGKNMKNGASVGLL